MYYIPNMAGLIYEIYEISAASPTHVCHWPKITVAVENAWLDDQNIFNVVLKSVVGCKPVGYID